VPCREVMKAKEGRSGNRIIVFAKSEATKQSGSHC